MEAQQQAFGSSATQGLGDSLTALHNRQLAITSDVTKVQGAVAKAQATLDTMSVDIMKQVDEKLDKHKADVLQSIKDEVNAKVKEVLQKELAPALSAAARAFNGATVPGATLAPVPITAGDAAGTVPANLPTTVFELQQLGEDAARAALTAYGVPIDPNDRPRKRLAVVLGVPYTEP